VSNAANNGTDNAGTDGTVPGFPLFFPPSTICNLLRFGGEHRTAVVAAARLPDSPQSKLAFIA